MSSSFAFVPIIGGVVYFGDGPLIHGLHHDGDGVARSLILRTSVPLAGAAVGAGLAMLFTVGQQYYTTSDCTRGCIAGVGAVFGFGLGMVTAMVVDWATASGPSAPAGNAGEAVWWPALAVTSTSVGIGLGGRF